LYSGDGLKRKETLPLGWGETFQSPNFICMEECMSQAPGTMSRREALRAGGALLGACLLPAIAGPAEAEHRTHGGPESAPSGYNILFLLVDQEHFFDKWPFPVPGRERLKRAGITFLNHQTASCVCSSARSVIYTGQHIQHTGVFDNVNAIWQPTMSPEIPTVGRRLQQLGYHSAYQGKWHLGMNVNQTHHFVDAPMRSYADVLKSYGFDDYAGVGDLTDSVLGGYSYDGFTEAATVTWLRTRAHTLAGQKKPWFLAVNLVNPHDVMYIDSDAPGLKVQGKSTVLDIAPPPHDEMFRAEWNLPLPASRRQALDARGRPKAHRYYQEIQDVLLGAWPNEDRRWKVLRDFYFNSIRDADRHVVRVLDELAAQGFHRNTIVVLTADHGELGGAHQMRGKGSTAYREQNHIPLMVYHPAYAGGKTCRALTSQLDITPTLLSLTGRPAAQIKQASAGLKGQDFSRLFAAPEKADFGALRPATLFNYNMFTYLDPEWGKRILTVALGKGSAQDKLARLQTSSPDFENRCAIRSVFDGRYRFSRYFSPLHFNRPTTLEALTAHNDLELYDLHHDPDEMNNLAVDVRRHGDLLMAMNARMNNRIDFEVGDDNASFLPLKDGTWYFPSTRKG
jgi:arylsulfatase A-like enzyme